MSRFRLVLNLGIPRGVRIVAMGTVDLVVGAGEVVADLLGDEFLALGGFAVVLDLSFAHIKPSRGFNAAPPKIESFLSATA